MRENNKYDNKENDNKPKKQGEKLSCRDIEDLMGIHRATYRRCKGGAIKQK